MPVEGDAQQGDAQHEGQGHAQLVAVLVALVDAPYQRGGQYEHVDQYARVERHAQRVDEQQLEPSAHLHDARHHPVEHHGHQHGRAQQRQERAFGVGAGHFFVVIYQHDGGQAKQVQQVNADAEARQVGDEHQPAVAVRLVGHVLPLQDQPEHHGGEQRREGIYLALHGREPERVAERIGQRAHQSAAHHGDELGGRDVCFIPDDQLADQVRDGPEEEQDARAAHQRAHVVHHLRHLGGVGGELREQVGHQHEERCAGRVSHFQFVSGRDELGAIPETCGRFDGQAIDRGRNEESNPTHQVVDGSVLFHSGVSVVMEVQR